MADQKEQDERFAKVYKDPRFRTLRKKDKTLKIDKRFKSMFTDEKFTLEYSIDKRGRSRKHLIAEDYKKFYHLDDEDEDQIENVNEELENEYEDDKSKMDEDNEKNDMKLTHKFGYHRGFNFKSDDEESNEESSSSSSSESEEDEDEEEELEHDWGELDKDAKRIDEATCRIAICNADWDRINAQDLYVLLNSFKMTTGTIHSVRIYYSKFGEERLKVEEEKGPSEFIFGKAQAITTIGDNDDDNDIELGENEDHNDDSPENPETVEKLRKYQLERLKYYYAVVECDSANTAETIYNELDGLEYESSSTTLDIRFIPDDMDFDDVRLKEECTSMPNSTYKAPSFTNSALQQCNVKITWDETDPKRKDAFNKAFEEENEDDIKAYLATSSEDEEEPEHEEFNENMKDSDKINKYKNLLTSLDKENEKDDFDLEVTWEPKIKSNTKDLLAKKSTKNVNNFDVEDFDDAHQNDSEAEESFNKEEKSPKIRDNKINKKIKNKKIKNKFHVEDKDETNRENSSNLELLMMDIESKSDSKKKHFNYKNIVENFNKGNDQEDSDGFKFDAEDSRFKSIYNSHLYNIDQSDPNFKRTKAFEEILKKQKQKAHRMIEDEQSLPTRKHSNGNKLNDNYKRSLDSLVNKVKNQSNKKFRC